jgi:hypothetical protein
MAYNPVYKIVPGSAGSFLCPPGHPNHTYHLEGKESPRHRTIVFSGGLDYALSDEFDGSDYTSQAVRKMMDEATMVESELWIRSVYGYFRTAYAPEAKPGEKPDRNVSNAVYHSPADIAVKAVRLMLERHYADREMVASLPGADENYRDGSRKPMRGARRGYEVTATADGSEVFVYALADDGSRYGALDVLETHALMLSATLSDVRIEPAQDRNGKFIPERVRATNPVKIDPIDPERHLAVLCIREYFPDHTPRLDLIDNPGKGHGSYPCTKCGEKVQYEAKFDKLTKVSTRVSGGGMTHWSYDTECPEGGDHTTEESKR